MSAMDLPATATGVLVVARLHGIAHDQAHGQRDAVSRGSDPLLHPLPEQRTKRLHQARMLCDSQHPVNVEQEPVRPAEVVRALGVGSKLEDVMNPAQHGLHLVPSLVEEERSAHVDADDRVESRSVPIMIHLACGVNIRTLWIWNLGLRSHIDDAILVHPL